MSYLYYILRLFFQRKTPLYPINKVQILEESNFNDLNKLYKKDGLQFDIYGNPYIDDIYSME
jgi:hypothetical protein